MHLQKKLKTVLLGLVNPLYGLHVLMKNPQYILHVVIIFLGNALIFALILFLAITLSSSLSSIITESLKAQGTGDQILTALIYGVILFITLFIYWNLFLVISSVVNAPVIGDLAERLVSKRSSLKIRDLNVFESIVYSLKFEVSKIALQLAILAISSLLNLIPIIGSALFVIVNILTLVMVTGLDIAEPVLARLNKNFPEKIKFVAKNPELWPALLVTGVLNSMPIINLLALPLNYCAGIMLVIKTIDSENNHGDRKDI